MDRRLQNIAAKYGFAHFAVSIWISMDGPGCCKMCTICSGLFWRKDMRESECQGRPKAPPVTQNASQKSLGTKRRKFGGQIYRFVSREN